MTRGVSGAFWDAVFGMAKTVLPNHLQNVEQIFSDID
jgi:hypothetical protein